MSSRTTCCGPRSSGSPGDTTASWLTSGWERDGEPGEVCVGDRDSTIINADRPERVYLETVQQHVELLTRLIEDPEYNRVEQLREFDAHWGILCRKEVDGLNELFVSWDGHEVDGLQVKLPQETSTSDLGKAHIALANSQQPASVVAVSKWALRQTVGKALGLPLRGVEPAPATPEELSGWYFSAVDRMDPAGRRETRRLYKKNRRDYWLVFSAPIPDGETMFAIHWHSLSAGPFAVVRGGGRDRTMDANALPESGLCRGRRSCRAEVVGWTYGENRFYLWVVALLGANSPCALTSAGVGSLTISDPDRFSEENLYRHVLSVKDIGQPKTVALAGEMAMKHPWAEVIPRVDRLEGLRDREVLREFDLLVIAIGSPTVERVFAEYCREEAVGMPAMNCWLEAYGIGGHAILTMPSVKGCWHCAHVDPKDTLTRGLASNLNFLEPGQVVMRNQGGCGGQFLPYSGLAASHTATMAADLAVRFLAGEVAVSSKVSWMGCAAEARRASLEVSWRYRRFAESLQILPLHDANCDFCGG